MRAVAGTEPPAKIASFANWDTSKMGANALGPQVSMMPSNVRGWDTWRLSIHTKHDKPFGFLHTVGVGLRVSERLPFRVLCLLDFILSPMADEDRLSSPFDDDLDPSISKTSKIYPLYACTNIFALRNGGQVDLNLGLSQNIGRGGHIDQELCMMFSR